MIHLKQYENEYYDEKFEKYTIFIKDKFEIENHPFGKIDYNFMTNTGMRISIRLGGDIEPTYLLSLIEYFKECDGKIYIPVNGEFLYYNLIIPFDFLEKLDIEINSKKYNL